MPYRFWGLLDSCLAAKEVKLQVGYKYTFNGVVDVVNAQEFGESLFLRKLLWASLPNE
jgi:hypothetical protein